VSADKVTWIIEHLQGPKELLRIVSNALWLLALAQLAGADLHKIGLDPPVPWWVTLLLATAAWAVTLRLSAWQEEQKAAKE
jgi:hypothetical protein